MSAALILVLVYFMAMSLQGTSSIGGSGTSSALSVASPLATSSRVVPVPTPIASATAVALPAAGLITQAETASGVDTTGGTQGRGPTAIDPTTTFSVKQKVYIILQLHTGGQAGTVCLVWYLNGKETGQYEFSTSPGETTAYSYTIYSQAGAGSVDVYWSSTGSCADKALAQHVEFVVTS